jgi:hypothetical protein
MALAVQHTPQAAGFDAVDMGITSENAGMGQASSFFSFFIVVAGGTLAVIAFPRGGAAAVLIVS